MFQPICYRLAATVRSAASPEQLRSNWLVRSSAAARTNCAAICSGGCGASPAILLQNCYFNYIFCENGRPVGRHNKGLLRGLSWGSLRPQLSPLLIFCVAKGPPRSGEPCFCKLFLKSFTKNQYNAGLLGAASP